MLQAISATSLERNVLMDRRIAEVFSEVFQVPPEQVTDSLSPQDVTGWDSLGHVRLVTQLQEQFGVEFDVDEIMRMENVAEIKKILAARG
jgi:acyl carrier protein